MRLQMFKVKNGGKKNLVKEEESKFYATLFYDCGPISL